VTRFRARRRRGRGFRRTRARHTRASKRTAPRQDVLFQDDERPALIPVANEQVEVAVLVASQVNQRGVVAMAERANFRGSPVSAASADAAKAAASSWRTCSHAMPPFSAERIGESVQRVARDAIDTTDSGRLQGRNDVVGNGWHRLMRLKLDPELTRFATMSRNPPATPAILLPRSDCYRLSTAIRVGTLPSRCRGFVYGLGMPRRKRKSSGPQPTAKPQSSDQAPGEEVVQVNDQYRGGEPAPRHAARGTGAAPDRGVAQIRPHDQPCVPSRVRK